MNKLGSVSQNLPSKNISQKAVDTASEKDQQKKPEQDAKVTLSDKSKELAKELESKKEPVKTEEVKEVKKPIEKKSKGLNKPAIFFVSGFDWFGAGSIKGNYDGIQDMADSMDDAQKFSWDQKSEMLDEIKKRSKTSPVVLVGHSFGGDTIVEIANELNTLENGFRTIDLLVTLDSVGFNNDIIPQNVKKNINFLAQGPYEFINDGPNIAKSFDRTSVENYLTEKLHADLDDAKDIQIEIMDAIHNIV